MTGLLGGIAGAWARTIPAIMPESLAAGKPQLHHQTKDYSDRLLDRPTNDLSSDQANFDGSQPAGNAPKGTYPGRPSKVGSYQPNRLGLYDMHGNVREWCEDLYAGGPARVFRGGSWRDLGSFCRASNRHRYEPANRHDALGLRLAAVPAGE
jgi:formylglycine-generating enzyme required for sulfatase activity